MVSNTVKGILVLLVLAGVGGLLFLLSMAIRGEVVRKEDHSDQIRKMVIVENAAAKSAPEDAALLLDNYKKFLANGSLDAEFAYQVGAEDGLNQVKTIMELLGLPLGERVDPEELETRAAVSDQLFTWLSPEGTAEYPEAETIVPMLWLMTVDQVVIDAVIVRLDVERVTDVRALIFEAWPTEVKFAYLKSNSDSLHQLTTFENLQETRKKLCPDSTEPFVCIPGLQ